MHFLNFASDAERLALAGLTCWVLAGLALLADRKRNARVQIDRIGWMPWTGLFLSLAVLGGGLLFMAFPSLLGETI